jgi:hypothetical protein
MKQQKHASRVVGGTNLNNVTDPITRTVKAMSSANGSIHSSMNSFASAAKNPKQFPKMVVAVTLASGLVGFAVMQIVDHKREVCISVAFLNWWNCVFDLVEYKVQFAAL